MKTGRYPVLDNSFLTVLPLGPNGHDIQVEVHYEYTPACHSFRDSFGVPVEPDIPARTDYSVVLEIISGKEHDFKSLPVPIQLSIQDVHQKMQEIAVEFEPVEA